MIPRSEFIGATDRRDVRNGKGIPRKTEYLLARSLSHGGGGSGKGNGKMIFSSFSFESLLLLIGLTASLLILPLVLPPLPPPPLMLLMLPICIFAVLMALAFMPTNARQVAHSHIS